MVPNEFSDSTSCRFQSSIFSSTMIENFRRFREVLVSYTPTFHSCISLVRPNRARRLKISSHSEHSWIFLSFRIITFKTKINSNKVPSQANHQYFEVSAYVKTGASLLPTWKVDNWKKNHFKIVKFQILKSMCSSLCSESKTKYVE